MSFPASYNIRYYKGDLYQFVIRPKTSAGEVYPIYKKFYYSFFKVFAKIKKESRGSVFASTIASEKLVLETT